MSRFDRRCDTEFHGVRRLEVINGELERRKWSVKHKGEIVAGSMQPGAFVSEAVLRHNLTLQQLFAWRHNAKQGRLTLPEEASHSCGWLTVVDNDSPLPASSAMD